MKWSVFTSQLTKLTGFMTPPYYTLNNDVSQLLYIVPVYMRTCVLYRHGTRSVYDLRNSQSSRYFIWYGPGSFFKWVQRMETVNCWTDFALCPGIMEFLQNLRSGEPPLVPPNSSSIPAAHWSSVVSYLKVVCRLTESLGHELSNFCKQIEKRQNKPSWTCPSRRI